MSLRILSFFYLVCWFVLYSPSLLLILILSFFLPQIYCFCSVCLPSLFFLENLYLLLAAGCLLSMESPPRAGFLNAKSFARPAARVNVQHACIYAVRTAVYSTSTAAAVCVCGMSPCSPRPYCRASLFFFHRQTF